MDTKSQPTPGPWLYEGTAESLHAIRDSAGVGIAQALHRRDKREQYANARLIAAAPEMLDALRWCSGADDFQEGGRARTGWLKVRALLDRIEGKETP